MSRGWGVVVWFSGPPCAGKRTLAERVASELRSRGLQVEPLGAEPLGAVEVRATIGRDPGFSDADGDADLGRGSPPVLVEVYVSAPAAAGAPRDLGAAGDPGITVQGGVEPVELSVQRVVAELERRGLVGAAEEVYSASEEEELVGRLRDLGYVD